MKTILIILDGASEEKIKSLNNKTPLEYSYTPSLDEIIHKGKQEKTTFYPKDRMPDSLCCTLSILGVNENLIPKNRAYLEALASDIEIEDNEVALRCNLISINNNKLESFNGEGLSDRDMNIISNNIKVNEDIKFHHISSYRNILVINKKEITSFFRDFPPHEHLGSNMNILLEDIRNITVLKDFTEKNKFTINKREYMYYPWGVSEPVKLPSFFELYNKTCSCVCSAEIIKGIGKAMKMDIPTLKKSTGDTDTDLREKAHIVLEEINSYDVVIAHINGTDEVSHRKDINGKVKFIEKIDREFISEIYKENKNTKIIIISDHQTSSITGKHEKGLVDVIKFIPNNYK